MLLGTEIRTFPAWRGLSAAILFSAAHMPLSAKAADHVSKCDASGCFRLPGAINVKKAAQADMQIQNITPKNIEKLALTNAVLPGGKEVTHIPRAELGNYARPVDSNRISSAFGMRYDATLGYKRLHAGIDIAGSYGSQIYAIQSGRVDYAGRAGSYGLLVRLRHLEGLETRYAHLSRIAVTDGMYVMPGQVIGYMGSTGRSTGNHLHFEVRQDGGPIDPGQFLASGGRQRLFARYKPRIISEVPAHKSEFSQKITAEASDETEISFRQYRR